MADKQWYFNTVTQQPELGPQSPVSQRMGPYRSREDALDAWRIVEERNSAWDAQDREWNRWPKPRHDAAGGAAGGTTGGVGVGGQV
ncbi:hypothetical protein H7U32_01515 [Bifidobacterium pullorum subsp. saeculare]|uniref:SPOR domain-containing protein n=1 Tax=Bifidobacterium pullorum subsp. saeculare TaxID=78257 RepID=A0A938WUK9_9BIFI|nr:hypothetical protein [Bifidobacterium pullorum]MBM6699025.1 hypothetical protein [Bifidobacterium pullorum subsp. saeculare]